MSDFHAEELDDAFDYLSQKITWLCGVCSKEILLMIDEVDKSSDNQIFLNFLGMLRNKYLFRSAGRDVTFKSVILAGVYDVRNLKHNSPWNIRADNEENEILHIPCTLFDDLTKNYENHPELQRMIDDILLEGIDYTFTMTDPVIQLGVMFGIFKSRNNCTVISNIIFDTLLYNHVLSKKNRKRQIFKDNRSQFIKNGKLDMPHVLDKFQEIMKAEYRQEGIRQLENYLDSRGNTTGYLVSFSFLKEKTYARGWIDSSPAGRKIYEITV